MLQARGRALGTCVAGKASTHGPAGASAAGMVAGCWGSAGVLPLAPAQRSPACCRDAKRDANCRRPATPPAGSRAAMPSHTLDAAGCEPRIWRIPADTACHRCWIGAGATQGTSRQQLEGCPCCLHSAATPLAAMPAVGRPSRQVVLQAAELLILELRLPGGNPKAMPGCKE